MTPLKANKPYVLFAIPCFNEALNLRPLLQEFHNANNLFSSQFEIKVTIINDFSTDNTIDVLRELKEEFSFQIVEHEQNKGLTGGINTAFNLFRENSKSQAPASAYGIMDGDNSHGPFLVENMFKKILSGFDIAIASRYQSGSRIIGVSKFRQLLSLGVAFLFKTLRNIPGVYDYSCGYRLYSPKIVNKGLKVYGNEIVKEQSFASMVEILVKLHLLGAVCTESPLLLRYDQKLGESKMPFLKTIKGTLKLLVTLRKF